MDANYIKKTLSMRAVADQYGIVVNQGGFARCPFHDEKTASMKIYIDPGRGFHCFGCDRGGSVIDFVMELFHLPYRAALVRISTDFGYATGHVDTETRHRARERREAEARLNRLAAKHCEYWNTLKTATGWTDELCIACAGIASVGYRIEVLNDNRT